MVGYQLAKETRRLLGCPDGVPVTMREICGNILDIPLVQAKLPKDISGATIYNYGTKGIVVNTQEQNYNVWIQRMTIAHELGHILWDPAWESQAIKVDNYGNLEINTEHKSEDIEKRASAFAVELLAPQQTVIDMFKSNSDEKDALRGIMEYFGIGFTSAVHHIENSFFNLEKKRISLGNIQGVPTQATTEWVDKEFLGTENFEPKSIPDHKRGRFSLFVVQAEEQNLISRDSAVSYLSCAPEEYETAKNTIRSLFTQG
jgi:hypothetical protein